MQPWEKLRELLRHNGAHALIIPHSDEWQNEYLSPHAERLSFATGFTGSAGCAIIGLEHAVLLTDGRYTLQARSQVDTSFFDILHSGQVSVCEWLEDHLGEQDIIFIDPKCHSAKEGASFAHLNLRFMESNWVDKIWDTRPPFLPSPVFDMAPSYIDQSFEEKKNKLLDEMTTDVLILASPESIAWLMNKRGTDILYTPVFLAFAILEKEGAFEVFSNATGKGLGQFQAALEKITHKRVSIDPSRCSLWIENILKTSNEIVQEKDPCLLPKACKTPNELKGMRQAHRLDAIAMTEFLAFLQEEIEHKSLTEVEASDILYAFRAKEPSFLSLSFATISGADANGAIVHYKAEASTCGRIGKNSIYLVDSGAQYLSGTTDITRTMAFTKEQPQEIKNAYTAVLKGLIHLSSAKFPKHTTGHRLDALARYYLWQQELDYDHGTGHGVGAVLSVHEGPQGISSHPNPTPLMEGMVVSIEPGYYQAGDFGIRIENLAIVVASSTNANYLEFETLTLVPIYEDLIQFDLLNKDEIQWLKEYHTRILKELSNQLSPRAKAFLEGTKGP